MQSIVEMENNILPTNMSQDNNIHQYGIMINEDWNLEDYNGHEFQTIYDERSGRIKYKCKSCEFQSFSHSIMYNHEESSHNLEKICNFKDTPVVKNLKKIEPEMITVEADIETIVYNQAHNDKDKDDNENTIPGTKKKGYYFKCGHCEKESDWRQTIQRHCIAKHNGDINVIRINEPRKIIEEKLLEYEINNNSIIDTSGKMIRVWVFKNNRVKKMIKCAHCPQVSFHRASITRHHKLHNLNKTDFEDKTRTLHSCNHCTFSCFNYANLLQHVKVHYGILGIIAGKYDPNKSDIIQINDILAKYNV